MSFKPQKIDLPKLGLRYIGKMDIEALYRLVVDWMESYRMWVLQPSYKDKVSGPGMTEKQINLKGLVKLDTLTGVEIVFTLTTWDTRLEPPGPQTYTGRLEILLEGKISEDTAKIFTGKSNFVQNLGSIWQHASTKERDELVAKVWYERMQELHGKLKANLGILT